MADYGPLLPIEETNRCYDDAPSARRFPRPATPANPLCSAARESGPATDLYYVRARWYDAGLGRFISEDPIGFGQPEALNQMRACVPN